MCFFLYYHVMVNKVIYRLLSNALKVVLRLSTIQLTSNERTQNCHYAFISARMMRDFVLLAIY